MLLNLNVAATKLHLPVNQAWSVIAACVQSHMQRSRDRRILLTLNDHDLRDIGLDHSQGRKL